MQPAAARSDADIKADIGRQLRWDARVDHALLGIDVEGGQVTLSGIVGSAAEKRIAVSDAWVAGVKAVDAAGLDVQKWARDPELRRDKYAVTSDEAIREAVKDALLYDLRVTSTNVTPEVQDGVVTLRGTVATLAAKRAAAQDARHTVGVSRVENQLTVRPPTSPAADALANEVRQAVARDPYLKLSEIHVHVDNGSVYLSGAVDSNFEKARADNVAAGVPGVLAVNNNLGVMKGYDALVYNPYVDEGYGYDYPWYRLPASGDPRQTDAEIREEIQGELWWSPFVDAEAVGVAVENGVATLTGSVDSWSEWNAAIANAYEGGARRVVDKLLVK